MIIGDIGNNSFGIYSRVVLIGLLPTVIGFIEIYLLLQVFTAPALFERVYQWSIAGWSLSIAIQVTATCLIAWKVWAVQRASPAKLRSSRSLSVVTMILESGATLSFSTVILLGFFAAKKEVGAILVAIVGQLAVILLS